MAKKVEIRINDREFRKAILRIEKTVKGGKEIRAVLRKSAAPWPEAVNTKIYNYVTRRTGSLGKAIGLRTFYAKYNMEYGVTARPIISKNKSQGGWKSIFFASPARHISKGKKIPFGSLYSSVNSKVLSNVKSKIPELLKAKFGKK